MIFICSDRESMTMIVSHGQIHSSQQSNSLEQVDHPPVMSEQVLPDVRSYVHEISSDEDQDVLAGLE